MNSQRPRARIGAFTSVALAALCIAPLRVEASSIRTSCTATGIGSVRLVADGPPVTIESVEAAVAGSGADAIPYCLVKVLVPTAIHIWVGLPMDGSSLLKVDLPDHPIGAVFDDEHLRRVLVNLLDNAHRHASRRPGSVQVQLASHGLSGAQLLVGSDGEAIAPDVEPHLFEPFFSTRSRGTGLGLYICRELCERYGASIDYRRRPAAIVKHGG